MPAFYFALDDCSKNGAAIIPNYLVKDCPTCLLDFVDHLNWSLIFSIYDCRSFLRLPALGLDRCRHLSWRFVWDIACTCFLSQCLFARKLDSWTYTSQMRSRQCRWGKLFLVVGPLEWRYSSLSSKACAMCTRSWTSANLHYYYHCSLSFNQSLQTGVP